MEDNKIEEKDKWELLLEEKLEILTKCQEEKGLNSCFNCELLLECKIRDEYVDSVYKSMNKGEGGGFEF